MFSDRFLVRFAGHPDQAPYEIPIPLSDLSQSPFVCSGNGEPRSPYRHWVRRGDGCDRIYDYVGLCRDVAGPHVPRVH